MATPPSSPTGCKPRVRTPASSPPATPGERDDVVKQTPIGAADRRLRAETGFPMKAFADLYTALDETTKTTRQGPGAGRLFRPGVGGRRGLGRLLPDRPQAAAGGARRPSSAPGPSRRPAFPTGCSRSPTTPSATSPRPSPCCCPRPASRATCPLRHWVEERLLPLRATAGRRPAAGDPRGLADARPPAAVRLEQADQRRLPRRRLAAARDPSPRRGRAASTRPSSPTA